ncbi:uncharacterized protein Z518_02661 [Rhinocladiella mackenziei CBS 650.93]|uniref:Chromate transporter n=1 Tax=Rhinocladiella mackenziei CBS 650.93 TaxID=1442369 RepID=A0A0D2IXG7_9EURO|nr:uncharacterized protein Z518_02661 [Rhinocladiella mackenziei CBS 650.93]KIX08006.1 hypothetical protein Z518_02661 [Rhinocladiella mackenziei CBS 650.93]
MTLLGQVFSFTFAFVLGPGVVSGIDMSQQDMDAWTNSQGGSGSGALLVQAYSPLGDFGQCCAVIAVLGGIGNMIPPHLFVWGRLSTT